ncbi:hypothetical protein SERLA73DRAFT_16883, partial [Serpula lacrymans var. lacrymans S7.3]
LPPLPVLPPEFIPTPNLTKERLYDEIKLNSDGLLWPEEEKLFTHIIILNQRSLAFEETDRGTFREDYFSPYVIPVLPHVPWEYKNIPIPPGIKNKVIELLRDKTKAGVYEPSQ